MNKNQKILGVILLCLLVFSPALFLLPGQFRVLIFVLWLIVEFFGLGFVLADWIDSKIDDWINFWAE